MKNSVCCSICLALVWTLLLGIKATEAAIVHTNLTACSDGLLTIPVKPVKRDLIIDLYWKYRYSDGSDWTIVVYCNKTMAGCRLLIPVLSDGTRVLRGDYDQSLTVEHSRQSTRSRDHIQFQIEVVITDVHEQHIFKVDFNIVCVPTKIDGNLNLTRVLFDIYPPEQLIDIDFEDANGTRFAYINTERGAATNVPNNNRPMPAFWSRLKVIDGSLMLTGIQKKDNGAKMISKAYVTGPEPLQEEKTIQILVHSPGSEPINRTPLKPSSHSMNVSVSPSIRAVKPLLFGSPSAASASQGQLWTVVLTVVAIFFAFI